MQDETQDETSPLNAEIIIIKEILEEKEDNEEKKDDSVSYVFIILFYFLGTACYVPHNFYITANEYWMYKFRDPHLPFNGTDIVQKTILQKNFTAYVGIASSIGMITFLLVLAVVHKRISVQKRIIGGMVALLVLFTFTLLFIFVDTDSWQAEFFVIALGIGALLSGFCGVLLISLLQLSSKFPPRCLAAQLSGQSICGVMAALIQIISLGAAPSVQSTAALYYSIALGTIAIIMVAYITILNRSEDFQNQIKEKPKELTPPPNNRPKLELHVMKRVFKKLRLLILSLVLCMGISGMLHPGLTALIESAGKNTNEWSDKFFLPVCVFLSFNAFEFIAREASNHFPQLKNIYIIFTTSVVRVALLPLILLCNLQPRHHLPVAFQDDAYFIIFIILLALSGGYVGNIAIYVLPECCEPEEQPIGMLVIVLVMVTFVPIFSVLSGVVVNLI